MEFARSKQKSAHQSDNAPIDALGVPPIGSLVVEVECRCWVFAIFEIVLAPRRCGERGGVSGASYY